MNLPNLRDGSQSPLGSVKEDFMSEVVTQEVNGRCNAPFQIRNYGDTQRDANESSPDFRDYIGQYGFEDDGSDDDGGLFHHDAPRIRKRSFTTLNQMRNSQMNVLQENDHVDIERVNEESLNHNSRGRKMSSYGDFGSPSPKRSMIL